MTIQEAYKKAEEGYYVEHPEIKGSYFKSHNEDVVEFNKKNDKCMDNVISLYFMSPIKLYHEGWEIYKDKNIVTEKKLDLDTHYLLKKIENLLSQYNSNCDKLDILRKESGEIKTIGKVPQYKLTKI